MNFNVDVAKKLMANASITLDKLKMRLNFSKLGVHIEKNGHLKLAHFLCRSLLNFDQIYLKMLYKIILLTITTINSTIKSMYREHFVLIVIIP